MRKKGITALYAGVQAAFWMGYCVAVGFAAVYLQALGYTNGALGAILAAGSLLGALTGTLLSSRIDRSVRATVRGLLPFLLIGQAAALIALMAVPQRGALTTVAYILYLACCIAVNSLDLKLYADLAAQGAAVNYGVARGLGSLAYVLISLLFGALVTAYSVLLLPWVGLALCAFQAVIHALIFRRAPQAAEAGTAERKQGGSLPQFLRREKRFCVLLLGAALLFTAHNTICNFLINIVRGVGGGEGAMGVLNAFLAAVEIPVMLLYSRLARGRDSARLLRFSLLIFPLKAAAVAAAPSVPLLFAACLLQAPSFALYTAAIVPYVSEAVGHEDSAKAQSLAFSMTTAGSVLSSLLAGPLFDVMAPASVLWIACAVCLAGAALALIGTAQSKK